MYKPWIDSQYKPDRYTVWPAKKDYIKRTQKERECKHFNV